MDVGNISYYEVCICGAIAGHHGPALACLNSPGQSFRSKGAHISTANKLSEDYELCERCCRIRKDHITLVHTQAYFCPNSTSSVFKGSGTHYLPASEALDPAPRVVGLSEDLKPPCKCDIKNLLSSGHDEGCGYRR